MSQNKPILVVSTRNAGKLREISNCLKDLPLTVRSLTDYPQIGEIEEEASTFEENARHKAHVVHKVTGGFVLADDSGLECEDLGGRPGVLSSRYAGPKATDDENNKKLVEDLMAMDDPSRTAQYMCVLVLIDPEGQETIVREICEGVITFNPGGEWWFWVRSLFLSAWKELHYGRVVS